MHWTCLWTRRTLGRPFISYFSTKPTRNRFPGAINEEGRQKLGPRADWSDSRPVSSELQIEQQRKHGRFKRRLHRAFQATNSDRERTRLWHAYRDLRQDGPTVLSSVSQTGWETLWKSQVSLRPQDSDRLENLRVLIKDMSAVGLDVTKKSKILQLEECVSRGEVEVATRSWLHGPSLRRNPRTEGDQITKGLAELDTELLSTPVSFETQLTQKSFDKEWLELGARLYALSGEKQRTSHIIDKLGHDLTKLDPRVAMSMLETLDTGSTTQQVEQAWNVFNAVLQTRDFAMTAQDLSTICGSFLEAGNLPYATSILTLMAEKAKGAEQQMMRIYKDHYGTILSKTQTLEEVDNISLDLLPHLPDGAVANIFFDKWLSHSAKAGDKDHTSKIIELMFERGRSPQARHIDKLLEVWIKSAGPERSGKAEALALSMIQKQLDSTFGLAQHRVAKAGQPHIRLKKYLRRPVPSADARTYVLLMSHYANSGDVVAAKQTLRLMTHSSSMRLDGQMTRAILSIHFTLSDLKGAWQFFQLVREHDAFQCDLRTAAILWKGVNNHLAVHKTQSLEGYPGPRHLYEVMLKDLFCRHDQVSLPVHERPPDSMYERIIHCFCLAEDTPGLILALHSLKIVFDINPSQKTVFSVINHVAHRMAWRIDKDDRAATFHANVEDQTRKMTDIVKIIWKRMQDVEPADRLFSFPGVFGKRPRILKGKRRDINQAKGEEILMLLTLFIRYYLLLDNNLAQRFTKAIDKARVDMGLTNYHAVDSRITDLRLLAV